MLCLVVTTNNNHSLDDIEKLVFIMQKHCVFREVEVLFLYIIYINLGIY